MTAIEEVLFDRDRVDATSELFPEFISSDDWIVYHGTSSVYEGEIERSGLRPSNHIAEKKEIQEVVSVYKKMNWYGEYSGGLAVLEPFTLGHDLADPRGKPVYFAESSRRASLYATRDFSGGECARALRYALGDLQKYLESPAVRENHNQMLRREFEHLLCNEELYRKAVMPVDLRWLKQKMNSFETLLQHCQELYDNHTHGVVYAVKFAEKYSETLEYHREMGIKSFCPVSLETIVAKVKLPLDYQCTPFQDNKRINAILDKKGLYAMF